MQLRDLKDQYSGRIFILGTGPSLVQVESWEDMSPTFGCNKLGYWDQAPLTDFYACNYSKVIKGEVPNPQPREHKFLAGMKSSFEQERYLDWPDWVWVTKGDGALESGKSVINTFGAMTLVCAQIAYVLGFREMYLLGCDQTNRGSIFDPDDDRLRDQPRGTTFTDPLPWWRYFKEFLEKRGGSIHDCTVEGSLNAVLPFRSLEEVLCGVKDGVSFLEQE